MKSDSAVEHSKNPLRSELRLRSLTGRMLNGVFHVCEKTFSVYKNKPVAKEASCKKLLVITLRPGRGGGGAPWNFWWGCAARIQKCHFPHPFSDLASKIHTRFQTWPCTLLSIAYASVHIYFIYFSFSLTSYSPRLLGRKNKFITNFTPNFQNLYPFSD